ncbi:VanZ family protein [Phycicoccus sp. CSK15P-2]|uniref:VanZ family protein n=1 Tax=Phycicoccus sp. CSK15P-2 TaxID=2807627 RepID=UPI00194E8E06|nr:VanZ family protein [Phycicoccus sp. CSK15P-2]MBM6406117.1 VanZ family protein [Phycicoccus sp. CSK15P-2]
MFPVGGVAVMLLGAVLSGLLALSLAMLLRRRFGVLWAFAACGFLWSLVVVALVTLIPYEGAPGVIPADQAQTMCSFDYGGPAPEGFWIFSSGQRTLNTALFVPSGVLMVVMLARWRSAWVLVPLGLAGLVAYSIGIEVTQLALARLDRACDVTDMVDNVTGALFGVAIGLLLVVLLRPWRHRRGRKG